jgi:hypothetical protein
MRFKLKDKRHHDLGKPCVAFWYAQLDRMCWEQQEVSTNRIVRPRLDIFLSLMSTPYWLTPVRFDSHALTLVSDNVKMLLLHILKVGHLEMFINFLFWILTDYISSRAPLFYVDQPTYVILLPSTGKLISIGQQWLLESRPVVRI